MGQDASPGIQRYLTYSHSVPRLTREEEHELALRVRDHDDPEALDKLARANLRYVIAIALKYGRYRVPLADLVSEGNVGLVIAARKFDPDRGTRFVTYAAHWIRACILEHVIRGSSMVGSGSGPMRSKVFFRLRREKAKLMGQGLSESEVAAKLAESFGTTTEKLSSSRSGSKRVTFPSTRRCTRTARRPSSRGWLRRSRRRKSCSSRPRRRFRSRLASATP